MLPQDLNHNSFNFLTNLFQVPPANFPSMINKNIHDESISVAKKLFEEVPNTKTFPDFRTVNGLFHKIEDLEKATEKDINTLDAFHHQLDYFSRPIKSRLSSAAFKLAVTDLEKLNDLIDVVKTPQNLNSFSELYLNLKRNINESKLFSADEKSSLEKLVHNAYEYANCSFQYSQRPPEKQRDFAKYCFDYLWDTSNTQYAIRFATKHNLIQDTPEDIGKFLFDNLQNRTLTYSRVGSFIYKKENSRYLNAFLDQLDYHGRTLDQGLRLAFESLPRNGEAQIIDRCVTEFSKVFAKKNGITDQNKINGIYYLSFLLIQLHTELHNKSAYKTKPKHFEDWFTSISQQWTLIKDISPLLDLYSKDEIHDFYRSFKRQKIRFERLNNH